MFEVIKSLKPELCAQVIEHLKQLPMKEDKSSYAKGRKILWINREPSYGREVSIRKSYEDERIFSFCQRVFSGQFQVDYVLVSYSGSPQRDIAGGYECAQESHGIKWHRDASYAASIAGTINLGSACFGIAPRDARIAPNGDHLLDRGEQFHDLSMGDVVKFDSKHPHMCDPAVDRWAIHCWSAK